MDIKRPTPEEISRKIRDSLEEAAFKGMYEFDQSTEEAVSENNSLLMRILEDNKDTEYGRKYKFAEISNPDAYRENLPLTTYEDYEEAIYRMTENGEENILTAYPIAYYASTSGTSGNPKKVPVSDRGLDIFRNNNKLLNAVFSEFYKNTRHCNWPYGRRLLVASLSQTTLKCGINFGSISAASITPQIMPMLHYLMCTPAEVMMCSENINLKYLHALYGLMDKKMAVLFGAYIPALLDLANCIKDEWKSLVEDIRSGTINKSVQMPDELREKLQEKMTPDPERASELEREFSKGFGDKVLKRIWPNLSGIAAIWAGNFSSYARKLQEFTGRSIPYYTMSYSSSEGVFGVARHAYAQEYVLIPQSCFFEFIPQNQELGEDETKTVLIGEVQEGKDYELVITNQSGFYRYRMGDVIRVTGFYNESPTVVFKYRKKNILSIAGEKFTEDHLFSAVQEFRRRSGIDIIDYCIYPDRDAAPARYVVFLEPDEVVPCERIKECENIMAEELARASSSYAHYVAGGNMGKPGIVFLQKSTFQLYRELKMYKMGISENQLKPVRVLNTPELVKFFNGLKENRI